MNRIKLLQIGNFALVCLPIVVGCSFDPFDTPPPDVTTSPNQQQIQYCRDVMYINPELVLTPLGYYHEHGFQDDQIAFKFIARTDQIKNIFNVKFVPPAELVTRTSNYGLDVAIGETWWDIQNKTLVGGDFCVLPPGSPGSRALNIGISDNGDSTFTVYVSWFET